MEKKNRQLEEIGPTVRVKRGRLVGQLDGDLFFEFVNEVDVAGAPLGAGLDVNFGDDGGDGDDLNPDVALVDFGFEGADNVGAVVGDVFLNEDAVVADDADGGGIDLFGAALVAAADGVLAKRAQCKGVGTGLGTDTTGNGEGRHRQNRQNVLLHTEDNRTQNGPGVKFIPRNCGGMVGEKSGRGGSFWGEMKLSVADGF